MTATSQINWNPEKRVTIREIKGVNKTTYEVYARLPNGEQFRQRFNDEIKATKCVGDVRIKGLNLAKAKANNLQPSSLDLAQQGEYLRAVEILDERLPEGWSLLQAVNYAADNYHSNDHVETLVSDAVNEYIQFKEDEGKGKTYIANIARDLGLIKNKKTKKYEPKPGSFASLNKFLNRVTTDEFKQFINRDGTSKTTQNGIHKTYTSFINWASGCKPAKCAANLLAGVSRPGKDTKDPIGFTADEAERIIREAEKAFDGELVPFFALSLFGGLRTEEITGNNQTGGKIPPLLWNKNDRGENENYLIWDEDEDEDGNPVQIIEVRLRGKKAWRRTSNCPANLVAFLNKYKKESGEIAPKNWRKKYDYIRAKAGFKVERSSLTTFKKNRKGEKVEFDSLKVDDLSELKDICDDQKRPGWISNGARHACLSCYAKLHTVEKACDWGGNTPKVFQQSYDIGVTTIQAKKWFKIFPTA